MVSDIVISDEILRFVRSTNASQTYRNTELSTIAVGIGVIAPAFQNGDQKLLDQLQLLKAQLCTRFGIKTAQGMFGSIIRVVRNLATKELISIRVELPTTVITQAEYEASRKHWVGKKLHAGLNLRATAKDVARQQDAQILRLAGKQIGSRLSEHIGASKNPKLHRRPILGALIVLSDTGKTWKTEPSVLHKALHKYRNALLRRIGRQTAYMEYASVRKAFSMLIEHQLLPAHTTLPKNFKRPKSSIFQRLNNPALGTLNVYDSAEVTKSKSVGDFITSYEAELSFQLQTITAAAREEVYIAYKKFRSREDLISKSQLAEFENHPKLKLRSTNQRWKKPLLIDAFGKQCPLRLNNLIAYIDKYYEGAFSGNFGAGYIQEEAIHEYFGLTPKLISAMHAIIVDELGINPYSLYEVKVSKTSHKDEYVQVADDGVVRINVIKWRARSIQKRSTQHFCDDLEMVQPTEINSAIVLRMALEMSARHRARSGLTNLWVCNLTKTGSLIDQPDPGTFQAHFKRLCRRTNNPRIYDSSPTLMKLRISRALLIFIQTQGNSQATANYLGNTVRTALQTYVPSFLQQAIYRRKLAAYQSLFLYMATADQPMPALSLNMSEQAYQETLRSLFSKQHFGGPLFNALAIDTATADSSTFHFCVSEKSLAIAIAYAKNGLNVELKSLCSIAVDKVRRGPIALKKMLRNASQLSTTISLKQ